MGQKCYFMNLDECDLGEIDYFFRIQAKLTWAKIILLTMMLTMCYICLHPSKLLANIC